MAALRARKHSRYGRAQAWTARNAVVRSLLEELALLDQPNDCDKSQQAWAGEFLRILFQALDGHGLPTRTLKDYLIY